MATLRAPLRTAAAAALRAPAGAGCVARLAAPSPLGVATCQARWLSATAACLKDKRMGREFKIKRQAPKEEEGEEIDREAIWDDLNELRDNMKVAMAREVAALDRQTQLKISFSVGGTAGIESLELDGQAINKFCSISASGLMATVNVYHQKNVLLVKSAIEGADPMFQASMGATPTVLMFQLPKVTRERRDKLGRSCTDLFVQTRGNIKDLMKPVAQEMRSKARLLHAVEVSLWNESIIELDREYGQRARDIADAAKLRISGEESAN